MRHRIIGELCLRVGRAVHPDWAQVLVWGGRDGDDVRRRSSVRSSSRQAFLTGAHRANSVCELEAGARSWLGRLRRCLAFLRVGDGWDRRSSIDLRRRRRWAGDRRDRPFDRDGCGVPLVCRTGSRIRPGCGPFILLFGDL